MLRLFCNDRQCYFTADSLRDLTNVRSSNLAASACLQLGASCQQHGCNANSAVSIMLTARGISCCFIFQFEWKASRQATATTAKSRSEVKPTQRKAKPSKAKQAQCKSKHSTYKQSTSNAKAKQRQSKRNAKHHNQLSEQVINEINQP